MVPQMIFCSLWGDENRVSVVADRNDIALAAATADRSRGRIEIYSRWVAKITFFDDAAAALVVAAKRAGATRGELNRKVGHFARV